MRLIHCDNVSNCDTAEDEYTFDTSGKWIKAHRGTGRGAAHSTGPWHFCSWSCAAQFFESKRGTH